MMFCCISYLLFFSVLFNFVRYLTKDSFVKKEKIGNERRGDKKKRVENKTIENKAIVNKTKQTKQNQTKAEQNIRNREKFMNFFLTNESLVS